MNPASFIPTQPIQVFFCYAHSDEELRDKLAEHLTLLERQQVISAWYDRDIMAGSDWASEIDRSLNAAQIILLLVSASFLASDYCYDVEQAAMQRHAAGAARVIPIILRPCDWEAAAFGRLRPLPQNGLPITQWGDRDEAFLNVVQGIQAAILQLQNPAGAADLPTTRSPVAMELMSAFNSSPAINQLSQRRVEVKRRFEAAMPRLAKVARTTEVRAMVSLSDSLGLRAHLPDFTEAGDLISKKDTVGNEFPFEFPVDPVTAEPIPTNIYLAINAPGFQVIEPIKALHLAPRLDSGVVTFFLTPMQRQERARVAVELFQDSSRTTLLSSLSLVTEVIGQQDQLAQTVWQLVSLPFNLIGRFQPANAPEPEQRKPPNRPDMLSASAESDESETDIDPTTEPHGPLAMPNIDPELLLELERQLSFPKPPPSSPPSPPVPSLTIENLLERMELERLEAKRVLMESVKRVQEEPLAHQRPVPRAEKETLIHFKPAYWAWTGGTAIAYLIFIWLGVNPQLPASAATLAIYGLLAGGLQGWLLRRQIGTRGAVLWLPLTVVLYLTTGMILGLTATSLAIAPVRYLGAAIAVGSIQWLLLKLNHRRNS